MQKGFISSTYLTIINFSAFTLLSPTFHAFAGVFSSANERLFNSKFITFILYQ